ncbi:hypothetical protein [Streptomyces sp. WAC 06725]|uniref:hypothetical protein n=1 Tax=Streptomyces sp. WAC 06725 TaxID=2203209 RepID=UPI00163C044A|nr:hypothetical protein [Streptomyces sp. WAC 06725]
MRDAGTDRDVANRATVLRTVAATGLPWIIPLMETALTFHHAVRDAQDDLTATLNRLSEATADGDYTYYVNIATAMGDLPQPTGPTISAARQEASGFADSRSLKTRNPCVILRLARLCVRVLRADALLVAFDRVHLMLCGRSGVCEPGQRCAYRGLPVK